MFVFFLLVVYIGAKEIKHGLKAMHEIGCTRCQPLAAEREDLGKKNV